MKPALDHFEQNITRVRDLHGLYLSITATTTSAIDLSDLLRAEIVLAVSAFDAFIHELALLGMLEIQSGQRSATDAFMRFRVSMTTLQTALANPADSGWIYDAVQESNSHLTFQQPDKVADALRLVSSAKLWDEVGKALGEDPATTKATLLAIVDRRNKIAHEADLDPANPTFRWPIDAALTVSAVDAIDRMGRAVFAVL